jgi:UDP-N-acetylglucosamine/UDP-N-acetylgalactosamine 4-epimerase
MNRLEKTGSALRAAPRRWLVTGAAGFIGSHLLEWLLSQEQDVIALDNFAAGHRRNLDDAVARANGRGRYTFVEGDIRDARICREVCEGVDYVLHQAALGSVPQSMADPLSYHEVNVTGFMNVALAARDAGVKRLVYASSSAVYGDDPGMPKLEASIGRPLSPYGLTKLQDEEYAELFRAAYGLETVGLRYFNIFGRRQDPTSTYAAVIPQWVKNLLCGEPCYIHGDGETTRDFCFIDNIVQANVLSATRPVDGAGQVYNVGCGERTTLNRLYRLIRDGLATIRPAVAGVEPVYDDFRPGDVRHSQADITKIRTALCYEPTHMLAQGLRDTLDWYAENLAPEAEVLAACG